MSVVEAVSPIRSLVLPSSPIRRVASPLVRSAARTRARQPRPELVDLSLGAPSWGEEPGVELSRRVRRALAGPLALGYGPHAGEPELCRAIARLEGVEPEEVQITCGAQGALDAVVRAFLGPGRVALVPEPGFPAYAALARMAGATVVPYGLGWDGRFGLDSATLERVLAELTMPAVVFVNHPANPTGRGASPSELAAVAEACERHGALLVADEVYGPLAFSGAAESADPRREARAPRPWWQGRRCLRIGSMSKAWAAPGLRIGWLVGHRDDLLACRRAHAWAVTSAAGPSQAVAAELVRASAEIVPASRAALARRWQVVVEVWQRELGLVPRRPDGAFYLWLPVIGDGTEHCRALAESHRVLAVPGNAFCVDEADGQGEPGWVRLSFGGPPESLRTGMARWLRGALDRHQGQAALLAAWAEASS